MRAKTNEGIKFHTEKIHEEDYIFAHARLGDLCLRCDDPSAWETENRFTFRTVIFPGLAKYQVVPIKPGFQT